MGKLEPVVKSRKQFGSVWLLLPLKLNVFAHIKIQGPKLKKLAGYYWLKPEE